MKDIKKKYVEIGIFLILLALWFSWMVITKTSKKEQPILLEAPVSEFSDDKYTILFAKDGRGPRGDGSLFEIYSIKSDGSDLNFVKMENSALWEEKSSHSGATESMGQIVGDIESPTGDKKLIVKYSWLFFLFESKVYLEINNKRYFLMKEGISEFEWLSDGKRVVFSTAEKIGVIDIESKHFGYLTDGAGWIAVE